jgi:hypothetical protein
VGSSSGEEEVNCGEVARQTFQFLLNGSRSSRKQQIPSSALVQLSDDIKSNTAILISKNSRRKYHPVINKSSPACTFYNLTPGLYSFRARDESGRTIQREVSIGSTTPLLKHFFDVVPESTSLIRFITSAGSASILTIPTLTFTHSDRELTSVSLAGLDVEAFDVEFSIEDLAIEQYERIRPVVLLDSQACQAAGWNLNGGRLELTIIGAKAQIGSSVNAGKAMIGLALDTDGNGKVDGGSEFRECTSTQAFDWTAKHLIRLQMEKSVTGCKLVLFIDGDQKCTLESTNGYINKSPVVSFGGRKFDEHYSAPAGATITRLIVRNLPAN